MEHSGSLKVQFPQSLWENEWSTRVSGTPALEMMREDRQLDKQGRKGKNSPYVEPPGHTAPAICLAITLMAYGLSCFPWSLLRVL